MLHTPATPDPLYTRAGSNHGCSGVTQGGKTPVTPHPQTRTRHTSSPTDTQAYPLPARAIGRDNATPPRPTCSIRTDRQTDTLSLPHHYSGGRHSPPQSCPCRPRPADASPHAQAPHPHRHGARAPIPRIPPPAKRRRYARLGRHPPLRAEAPARPPPGPAAAPDGPTSTRSPRRPPARPATCPPRLASPPLPALGPEQPDQPPNTGRQRRRRQQQRAGPGRAAGSPWQRHRGEAGCPGDEEPRRGRQVQRLRARRRRRRRSLGRDGAAAGPRDRHRPCAVGPGRPAPPSVAGPSLPPQVAPCGARGARTVKWRPGWERTLICRGCQRREGEPSSGRPAWRVPSPSAR